MERKHGIAVGCGVIDADYVGEAKVILRNHGNANYEAKAGHHIAQLIVEIRQTHHPMKIDIMDDIKGATYGFGSRDVSPKSLIPRDELNVTMCFLNQRPNDN